MQPHRSNALRYASAARDAHSRVYGGCAAEAAVSEASGPRVSGCIRAPRRLSTVPRKVKPYKGLTRKGSCVFVLRTQLSSQLHPILFLHEEFTERKLAQ